MPSAQQERMTARSSAHSATWGSHSETQRPDWPCWVQVRGAASKGELNSPMAGMALPKLDGMGWAASSLILGLGSKKAVLLGPPFVEKKEMSFSFAGKRGGLGSRG